MSRARGQATVELLSVLPLVLLTGYVLFQLGSLGYTYTLADGAAEAGALALASGLPPEPAVRAALPGWARDRVSVKRGRGWVRVEVRPVAPVAALSRRLAVESTAAIAGRSR